MKYIPLFLLLLVIGCEAKYTPKQYKKTAYELYQAKQRDVILDKQWIHSYEKEEYVLIGKVLVKTKVRVPPECYLYTRKGIFQVNKNTFYHYKIGDYYP